MNKPARFAEFVTAQDAVYERVLLELAAGRKATHWMWFIFPQLAGLGFSPMAQKFALTSQAEAREYYEHAVLGPRLTECTRLMLAIPHGDVQGVLGYPDDLKFRSCMTLFAVAVPHEPLFEAALEKFFAGQRDPMTMQLLEGSRTSEAC